MTAIMSSLEVNHRGVKQGRRTRQTPLWIDCEIKEKKRKWFIFLCTVKSHSHICSVQLSGCQRCQIAAWVIYHHDSPAITKQKTASSQTYPAVLSLQLIIICCHSMWHCPTADILWQPLHVIPTEHVVRVTWEEMRSTQREKRICAL